MVSRRSEAGYTLVMLMAAVTIMLISMGLGVPFWRYLIEDDREQELLFRGGQIADAILRYQQRNANAPPPSLEALVEQRLLRRLYTDPMRESGEWRLIRPGEALPGAAGQAPGRTRAPGGLGGGLSGGATPTPTPAPASTRAAGGLGSGGLRGDNIVGAGVLGVASTSEEEGFRLFNGRSRYDEWLFIAGQPRIVGAQRTSATPGGSAASPRGIGPTPLPKSVPPSSGIGAGRSEETPRRRHRPE